MINQRRVSSTVVSLRRSLHYVNQLINQIVIEEKENFDGGGAPPTSDSKQLGQKS